MKLAVHFAICLFNDGEISVTRLLQTLEVLPGIFQELGIRRVDSTTLYYEERKTTEGFKKRRTALKNKKKGPQHMEQDNSRCNNRCKEPLFWPFYLYTVFIVCFLKTQILVLRVTKTVITPKVLLLSSWNFECKLHVIWAVFCSKIHQIGALKENSEFL